MIEELKYLLEHISDVPEMGMWILLGFGIYKLTIYMATTGSFVIIARLLINRSHDVLTSPKKVKVGYTFINDSDYHRVMDALCKYRSTSYIHEDDTNKIIKALDEGRK